MSARAIEVCAAQTVTDTDDKAAVLIKTGVAAFGLSIAEARFVAQRLARAADVVEFQIARRYDRAWREELPAESTYETRSAEQVFEDECAPQGDRR